MRWSSKETPGLPGGHGGRQPRRAGAHSPWASGPGHGLAAAAMASPPGSPGCGPEGLHAGTHALCSLPPAVGFLVGGPFLVTWPPACRGGPRTHHASVPHHGQPLLDAVGALGDEREVVLANGLLGSGEGAVGTSGHLEVPAEESRGQGSPEGPVFLSLEGPPTPAPQPEGQRLPPTATQPTGQRLPERAAQGLGVGDRRPRASGWSLDGGASPGPVRGEQGGAQRQPLPGHQGGEVLHGGGVRADGGRGDEGCGLGPVLAPVVRAVGAQAGSDGFPEHHHPCGEAVSGAASPRAPDPRGPRPRRCAAALAASPFPGPGQLVPHLGGSQPLTQTHTTQTRTHSDQHTHRTVGSDAHFRANRAKGPTWASRPPADPLLLGQEGPLGLPTHPGTRRPHRPQAAPRAHERPP